jgi:FkbM family methyltransferase
MLSKLLRKKNRKRHASYSQCGEDLIIGFLFDHILQIKDPYYVDIGAHDPVKLNNTYAMYQQGRSGILIEPNKEYFKSIQSARPRDTSLNVGLADTDGVLTYFQFDPDTLNTFDPDEAARYEADGHKLNEKNEFSVISPSTLLKKHCTRQPDFVSLDVEGQEIQVLESWGIQDNRPAVFCIETLEYRRHGDGKKKSEIFEFMKANEYIVYADTYINTIFVDGRIWNGIGTIDSMLK